MTTQNVRFLRSNFPFAGGDEAGLPVKIANLLRQGGIVVFIKAKEKERPPAPPGADVNAGDGIVEIPEDWEKLHHATRLAIARHIAGDEVTTAAEAAEIIREELARRTA